MKFEKVKLIQFASSLGLIFGAILGLLIAVMFNQDLTQLTGLGAAIGLITGSIIYILNVKK